MYANENQLVAFKTSSSKYVSEISVLFCDIRVGITKSM